MENRDYILDRLRSKTMSIDEFNYERLQAPPISSMFTPQDIAELNRLARSLKYAAKPDVKLKEIDMIMRRRGFVKFIGGTNRLVYRPLENNTFLVKVAIDAVGCGDNPREFQNQFLFKPFIPKVFEITPCGTLGVFERVNPITSREEFLSVAEDIYYVISNWFIGEYVLEDFGTKFFMNWGIRKGFGPVLLDFPYVYKLDGDKLFCNAPSPSSPTGCCDGVIDYDPGYNFLYCTKCGVRYRARELAKAVEENKVLVRSEGDVKMKVRIHGGDKNVNVVKETGEYAEMAKTLPGVTTKRVPVYTSGNKKGKVAYGYNGKKEEEKKDTPEIRASLKARPNVRTEQQPITVPEYVEKQATIRARGTRQTTQEAPATVGADVDVSMATTSCSVYETEEYQKLLSDNDNLHTLIRGLKMDLEGMTLRSSEMEEARDKAASELARVSRELDDIKDRYRALEEAFDKKDESREGAESPLSFDENLKGKTPFEQLDEAAGIFREAVDDFLNLHQFEGDMYTEATVGKMLDEYFQVAIEAIPADISREGAESPISFNEERKNMSIAELVVANADDLMESVDDYYNIMHSSEEETLDIAKILVDRFSTFVVSVKAYQEKCAEVENGFESLSLLNKNMIEMRDGFENELTKKEARITELNSTVEYLTKKLADTQKDLIKVTEDYEGLKETFDRMEAEAVEVDPEEDVVEADICKATVTGVGHHLNEEDDVVFDMSVELEWSDGYKREVVVTTKMEDLDVEVQKTGFIIVDAEEYDDLSNKAKGGEVTMSDISALEDELEDARKQIAALQFNRENVAGISTANTYGTPKYYSSTVQNIKDVFGSESPAKVLLITDNDGNYLTVGEENNLIAINVIDDRTVGSISIVSASWLSNITREANAARQAGFDEEPAEEGEDNTDESPVEYAVNGVATGVLPPQAEEQEEQ